MTRRTRILGVGSFVPDRIVTNDDMTQWMDTSDEWIRSRSGIEERHWVEPDNTTTSDLGLEAANKAMAASGITAADLDMILFATLSPDHEFPGTACFLQEKLGEVGSVHTLDCTSSRTTSMYCWSCTPLT